MQATPDGPNVQSAKLSRDPSAARSHWSSPRDVAVFMRTWLRAIKFAGRVRESGLFDTEYCLSQYKATAGIGRSPLLHYLVFGNDERVNPHPLFDVDYYVVQ